MKNMLESLSEKSWQNYNDAEEQAARSVDLHQLQTFWDFIEEVYDKNEVLFVAGNGGMKAIALHLAIDFVKGAVCEGRHFDITKRRMRVIPCGANGSVLSAWANDTRFDEAYFREIEGWDKIAVLALSCSGNSANIVNLVEYAREHNAKVMSIVGFDGGEIMHMGPSVHVKSNDYGIVEDVAHKIMHWTTQRLRAKILGVS
jgi:D-sedoheptulose 7-phosphate isomerase